MIDKIFPMDQKLDCMTVCHDDSKTYLFQKFNQKEWKKQNNFIYYPTETYNIISKNNEKN